MANDAANFCLLWFGKLPNVSSFKHFVGEVFVLDRTPGKGKLEPRSVKGIFIEYSSESKAYRIWLPVAKKIIIPEMSNF